MHELMLGSAVVPGLPEDVAPHFHGNRGDHSPRVLELHHVCFYVNLGAHRPRVIIVRIRV